MINYSEIVNRIKHLTGKSLKREVADLFNISAADFSNRKRRDTLLPLIIDWAIHESVNLDWLLTGQEPTRREPKPETPAVHENSTVYMSTAEKHADVYAQVRAILESDDDFIIKSLRDRVRDYTLAVAMNAKRRELLQRLETLEADMREIKGKGGPPGERIGDAPRTESAAPEQTPEGPKAEKMEM